MLMAAGTLAAQDDARLSDKRIHQPSVLPDRIVLTWRKNPARSQSVTWRTDTSVRDAVAEFAVATAGPKFALEPRKVAATTTPYKSDLSEAHYHTAHFEGLTPNTKYAYRVGDGVHFSEWNHFTTASEKPEKFSFLYFGDSQHQLKTHWSRVVREAYAAAPQARFSLHAGDLVNWASSDAQWGEWFQAAEWINRTMPVVPVVGNHEYWHDEGKSVPRYWKLQFPLPENGPKDQLGSVYHFDFQGARFVVLNTNEPIPDQDRWLDDVLKKDPQRWTIVTFHHPMYSSAMGRDNPTLRKHWQPILNKHRVDLVLQGHDHCYGRSALEGSPVYVVSVSGPVFYPVDNTKWMVRKGQGIQTFQVITIDGDKLTFEARTALGDIYDSFTLTKQPDGKANALTDGAHDPRSVPASEPGEPWSLVAVAVIVLLAAFLVAVRVLRRRAAAPP
jgi:hypothetical protein